MMISDDELGDELKKEKGRIVRAVGGNYTVETADGEYVAKARGVFRIKGDKSPCSGDIVSLEISDSAEPLITQIEERKNCIVRPPLSNLDLILIVVSSCEPSPNAFVLDKLLTIFESKQIETALIFTKTDKYDINAFAKIYEEIGYKCFFVDNVTGEGTESIIPYLDGKLSALVGNSGVGKSSLMTHFLPEIDFRVNEISKKLGRGKHTTREVSLFRIGNNGFIADTPGFSTVEISKYGSVPSEEIQFYFREFEQYRGKCRFNNCKHIKEDGCVIREAVAKSRYENYTRMYIEAKKLENTY